jgi:hypothetical protein
LFNHELKERNDDVSRTCADLSAAWELIAWLSNHFDKRALDATVPGHHESLTQWEMVSEWISAAAMRKKNSKPRFFDSRRHSLLAQLPNLVRTHASSSARNYLAMGSGFYETSTKVGTFPAVLSNTVSVLQKANILTKQPDIDIFVNPAACQAVATSLPSLAAAGWKVRPPGAPEYMHGNRSLHAKFIFSAIERDNSAFCNSAWLYLGSGNLTGPGFANSMSPDGGNLEAGVVLSPDSLLWCTAKGVPPECVLTNRLPLQWEIEFGDDQGALAAGSDMPDPQLLYTAAPLAYLYWATDETAGWLRSRDELHESVDVLDVNGDVCRQDTVKGFQWVGERPRQVQIRWRAEEQERLMWIPVLDEFGRFAAIHLPQIEIEEAWGQLDNFPMPPPEEEICPNGDADSETFVEQVTGEHFAPKYPVRQMMEFVENIAAKQTSVCQADWTMWCTRLEQCLSQAARSKILEEFVKLELNPLSPLWHRPFRPEFAESADTPEGARYEDALRRVETVWHVDGLSPIGSQHEADI